MRVKTTCTLTEAGRHGNGAHLLGGVCHLEAVLGEKEPHSAGGQGLPRHLAQFLHASADARGERGTDPARVDEVDDVGGRALLPDSGAKELCMMSGEDDRPSANLHREV